MAVAYHKKYVYYFTAKGKILAIEEYKTYFLGMKELSMAETYLG